MFKKQTYILLILVVMLVGYGVFTSGYRVNIELPAVKYRLGDEESFENIVIRIDGTYQRRLFSTDVFKGSIYLEGFEFTNESSGFLNLKSTLADIHFNSDGNGNYQYIRVIGDGEIQRLLRGSIYFKDKFSILTLTVMESHSDGSSGGWTSEDGLMISAPAKSRNEALGISNLLMKSNYR